MAQNYGYAGMILRVNLSTGEISSVPTQMYAHRFLGGRGIATKIYWDEVPPEIGSFDPENRLIFMTGPVCGVPGFAGSRWHVSGKSPINERFSYCNLGGSWGAHLKFAGYDGLVVHGRADRLQYLVVDDGKAELKDASNLESTGAYDTRQMLKNELGEGLRVVAIGPAGENRVRFATLLADSDSNGSSGLGAVMGSKNLKAVAVRGRKKVEIADPQKGQWLKKHILELKGPTSLMPSSLPQERFKKDQCYGCINGCIRATYSASDGSKGKYICQSAWFYEARAQRYYGEATEIPFMATRMCDGYGLNTQTIETMIMWLTRCYKSGILTEEETGLPLGSIGSLEFIEALLQKITFRDGFGDILAEGTHRAAKTLGRDSERFITDYMIETGENSVYGPRLYLATSLLYAMEPRMPIQQLHEISVPLMTWVMNQMGWVQNYVTSDVIRGIAGKFWGGENAADFSTIEGKALAAVRIQDREYAKESLIQCDFSWPIAFSPITEDHVGDPSLESHVYTAVTGIDIDEQGLYHIGERLFNLQRAVLAREGKKGREHDTLPEFEFNTSLKGDFGNPDCMVPGPRGKPFSRKGMVVERNEFEAMKDEFYEIRGWDVSTGLQTKAQLEELGLQEIAADLEPLGLVVQWDPKATEH